ncbi:lipopolysaccharide transport periplasmic protein LptA [Massilia sp. S19_KUP03_FR1]|uniref:lipopolysaccharide transport periplasmic protein LptA n=1 Tax=Massilia sp. S19_KUP03_FR1 TaxID=3025503 RepID=UPI002FCDA82C
MKTTRLTFCFLLLLATSAQAERADALKPISMESGDIHIDNVTRETIATGHVTIVRGTMVVNAERAEVKEAPDGYRTYRLTAAPGKLVTFRQKRDGGPDLWSEGHAERMEYDEREDVIKLHLAAMMRQLDGKTVTHQIDQAFISYDNRSEQLDGRNGPGIAGAPPNGRGKVIFEVRRSRVAVPPPQLPGQ